MSKVMIIIAALVVLIAGAVSLWTILHQSPPAAPVAATADNETSSTTAAPAPSHRPAVAALPIRPSVSALPPVSAAAVSAQPAALADQIATLTLKQEAALLAAARSSDHARRMNESRHLMPTDRYLRSAGLVLSDYQQRQLQAIKDALKPQQDAALSNIWSQIDELGKQHFALVNGATADQRRDPAFLAQVKQFADQLHGFQGQENAITNQLDQGYQAQVLAILTPEQQNSFHQAVGAMMHNFTPAEKR